MSHALDGRPLAVRLQKRIQKFKGCTAQSLVTDMTLHQQALDEIERLTSEGGRLLKALSALTQIAGECEQIASNYSGTIDGIFEHGGDDHEDPSCAIFHRLYYAMFDARAEIKKSTT